MRKVALAAVISVILAGCADPLNRVNATPSLHRDYEANKNNPTIRAYVNYIATDGRQKCLDEGVRGEISLRNCAVGKWVAHYNQHKNELEQAHVAYETQLEQQRQQDSINNDNNGLINLGLAMMAANADTNPYDNNAQMARALLQARGVNIPVEPMETAHIEEPTVTAFFSHRERSSVPTKQTCVYNYMGHKVGLLFPIVEVCPLSVNM